MMLTKQVQEDRLEGRHPAGARPCDYLSIVAAGHVPSSAPGAIPQAAVDVMRSRIFVRRLQLAARIGVYEWEKLDLQPVTMDLEFALPSELACHTDDVEDAVDYSKVVATLRHLATARHYELVEAMAEAMAGAVQRTFGVPWLRLTLAKLAPFPGAEVGIVVERGPGA